MDKIYQKTLEGTSIIYKAEPIQKEAPYDPPTGSKITYEASSKLVEVTDGSSYGLHTNAFNVAIKSHTFDNGVGTIEFDGELTDINNNAFRGCIITAITIPDSVVYIGKYAFDTCRILKSITSLATTAPTILDSTFYDMGSVDGTLYVPSGSTGYDEWMKTELSYLGSYRWTMVEQ